MSTDPTLDYYEAHAEQFFADTQSVDMAPLYERFLSELPVGALILDAGCGSGRDSKAFLERGYRVSAFDASEKLVALARTRHADGIICGHIHQSADRVMPVLLITCWCE